MQILLVVAALLLVAHAVKFNTDIDGCMAQVGGMLGGESDSKVKTAMESIVANTKAGDLHALQKVVKDSSDAEKGSVLNKYMADKCAPLRNCFVCPLELS